MPQKGRQKENVLMRTRLVMLCAMFTVANLAVGAHADTPAPVKVPTTAVAIQSLMTKPKLGEADRLALLAWLRTHPTQASTPAPLLAPTTAMIKPGFNMIRLPPGFRIPTLVSTLSPALFGVTLTFDDAGLSDGSVVDSFYAAYGATFSVVPGSLSTTPAHAYARAQAQYPTAFSPPNVVSVIPAPVVDNSFDERAGIIHVQFAAPQKTVSIMAYPEVQFDSCFGPITVAPYLRFLGANNQVLQTVSYPITNGQFATYAWTALTWMSSSANIAAVEFSSTVPSAGCHVYGFFDQLSASPF
jgi:hypothetical protein